MVRRDTVLILALASATLGAQEWRQIGNSSLLRGLAGPASGPVERVWFTEGGAVGVRLFSGNSFESDDLETWKASPAAAIPEAQSDAEARRKPQPAAGLRALARRSATLYAVGASVWRSDDEGETWRDLIRLKDRTSLLGEGFTDLAIDPTNPERIAVANAAGVWLSPDGGVTWTSLNEGLPNLPVVRIAALGRGPRGARIATADGEGWEWMPGQKLGWMPAGESGLTAERSLMAAFGRQLGGPASAVSLAADTAYLGLADGRVAVSSDRGRNWLFSALPAGAGAVQRFWMDPADPQTALAVTARARVLRSLNGGRYWDDVSGNLPAMDAFGLAADAGTGAVYLATGQGVWTGIVDLRAPALTASWTRLRSAWPDAAVRDVALDEQGNQLYAAVEGYGLFAAAAPHRTRRPLVVHTADYAARAAAPGALMSLLGARATSASAAGRPAPVLSASDVESQIQVPFEAAGDSLQLAFGNTLRFTVPLQSAAPAILIDREGTPMLLDADSGVQLDALRPARGAMRVQLLATGLGKVNPDWPTGLAAPLENAPRVAAPVRARLNGTPVEVTRATLAPGYIGFYLVELELPSLVDAGASELWLEVNGRASNRVRIYLDRE